MHNLYSLTTPRLRETLLVLPHFWRAARSSKKVGWRRGWDYRPRGVAFAALKPEPKSYLRGFSSNIPNYFLNSLLKEENLRNGGGDGIRTHDTVLPV